VGGNFCRSDLAASAIRLWRRLPAKLAHKLLYVSNWKNMPLKMSRIKNKIRANAGAGKAGPPSWAKALSLLGMANDDHP
jgi:hypothetical protein